MKASIRRLCEGWLAGTYRGAVNQGHDPDWVQSVEGRFEIVPERAAAIRRIIGMYTSGFGGKRIVQALDAEGLRLSAKSANSSSQCYRLFKMPQLMGTKPISVDGQQYLLQDYYPALL